MAEMCLDCYNEFHRKNKRPLTEKDVVMDYDYCEFCGKEKDCIVIIKEKTFLEKLLGI